MTRTPKEVYIIFDPLDGPHLFRSRSEAEKAFQQWKREAKDNTYDSFWEMSNIITYHRESKT